MPLIEEQPPRTLPRR